MLGNSHNGIPWRSNEVSRIEALSDAVFAFAVTLLVVALEVPQTFGELWTKMHGFFAFAISFALLFHVWYTQHVFFRRYGLQDVITIGLNGILLFLVLFYVYPLKFLFALLTNEITGGGGRVLLADGHTVPMLGGVDEARTMMIIYATGFGAIFAVFVILYAHALRRKQSLKLSSEEIFDARTSIGANGLNVLVALLSLGVTLTAGPKWAGMTYFLIGVLQAVYGSIRGKKRRTRFGN